MKPALTWQVIAVDTFGHGHGTCGHRHVTDLDAVRCPWTPDPWPVCCDLLVRQVRDMKIARGATQVRAMKAARGSTPLRRPQALPTRGD